MSSSVNILNSIVKGSEVQVFCGVRQVCAADVYLLDVLVQSVRVFIQL